MPRNTKAAFLDKDGLLNMNHSSRRLREGQVEWSPETIEGLRLLYLAGYALIVVTPEDEAARGRCAGETMFDEDFTLRISLAMLDIPLVNVYHCPHHPQGTMAALAHECRCRKPESGLLIQAADEYNMDPQRSWMIGDTLDDTEAGRAAGCRTILLSNGHETTWNMTEGRWPDFIAANMLEAASLIFVTDAGQLWDRSPSALEVDDEEPR